MIAHPPCTYLSNAGVRWLYNADGTINPIQHRYAREKIRRPDQIIQPWQFGHGETKATCLWLKNLPELYPTNIVEGREHRIHLMAPSENRWKMRSMTYVGIANAMAEQWGRVR